MSARGRRRRRRGPSALAPRTPARRSSLTVFASARGKPGVSATGAKYRSCAAADDVEDGTGRDRLATERRARRAAAASEVRQGQSCGQLQHAEAMPAEGCAALRAPPVARDRRPRRARPRQSAWLGPTAECRGTVWRPDPNGAAGRGEESNGGRAAAGRHAGSFRGISAPPRRRRSKCNTCRQCGGDKRITLRHPPEMGAITQVLHPDVSPIATVDFVDRR